jgi:hypothetical protein
MVMMWTFPDDPVFYSTFLGLVKLSSKEHHHGHLQAILEDVHAKLAKARLHPGSGENI